MRNLLDHMVPGSVEHQALQNLPPGVALYWVRGKILHMEFIQRPIMRGDTTWQAVKIDTIVALHDRDAPAIAYEVRFKGRAENIAPGEEMELIGHQVEQSGRLVPTLALSFKANYWWYALHPIRQGQRGFVVTVENTFTGWKDSYDDEGKGAFQVSVARPPEPTTPPAPPPMLGKLMSALPPSAAPAVNKLAPMVGKLQQAMTPGPPPFVTLDLLPLYRQMCDVFWNYAAGLKTGPQTGTAAAPEPAAADDEDLPPL